VRSYGFRNQEASQAYGEEEASQATAKDASPAPQQEVGVPTPVQPTLPVTLTLIGKPECHLCAVAKDIVDRVAQELGQLSLTQRPIIVEQRSILDDAELHDRYWEKIPVLLVNGVEHAHWRIDPDRLRAAILEV
jgi:hypothetical protein